MFFLNMETDFMHSVKKKTILSSLSSKNYKNITRYLNDRQAKPTVLGSIKNIRRNSPAFHTLLLTPVER